MAEAKKRRNPELTAVEKEYNRIRRNYLRYLRKYKNQGYISDEVTPISKPKRVTQGSVNRISKEYDKLRSTVSSRKQSEIDVAEVVEDFIEDAIQRAEDSSTLQGLRVSKSVRDYLNRCIRKYGKKNFYRALAKSPNAIIEAVDSVLFYKGQPSQNWDALNKLLYDTAKSLEETGGYPEDILGEEVRKGGFKFHVKGESEEAIKKILRKRGFTAQQAEEYIDNEYED